MFELTSTEYHLYLEDCTCDPRLLKDGAYATEKIAGAVKASNLTVVKECYQGFEGAGITAAVLLLESHVIMHSWPESNNSVLVDISVCNFSQDNFSKARQLQQALISIFAPRQKLIYTLRSPVILEQYDAAGEGFRVTSSLKFQKALVQQNSAFQDITLVESESFGRVLILDHVFQTSEKDEFFYHEPLVHVPLLTHDNPARVLIIGGGDGGAAKEVLKHKSVQECTLVEIDPAVLAVARQYLPAVHQNCFADPKLNVRVANALDYLKNLGNITFDVIILDITDPGGPSLPLYAEDFYSLLQQHLAPDGLLTLHLGAITYHPSGSAEIYRKLRRVFPRVRPYTYYVPLYGGIMAFGLCSRTERILSQETVAARITQRGLSALKIINAAVYQGVFALPNVFRDILRC